jgi:hypothetical protein
MVTNTQDNDQSNNETYHLRFSLCTTKTHHDKQVTNIKDHHSKGRKYYEHSKQWIS